MRRFVCLILVSTLTRSLSFSVKRTERGVCNESEYQHAGICCLNCPTGTFVKKACAVSSTRGECERCDYNTYTEHDNGLHKCLPCSRCRSDQELVEQCSTARDTECRCKTGSFCLPDHACEVCRKCSRCKEDEEQTENCTSHSDAVCRKRDAPPSHVLPVAVLIPLVILVVMVLIVVILYRWTSSSWKRAVASCWSTRIMKASKESISSGSVGGGSTATGQNSQNQALEDREDRQPFFTETLLAGASVFKDMEEEEEEEDEEGPPSTASSQTAFPVCVQANDACWATNRDTAPPRRCSQNGEAMRRLVPINDESLKKSFELFSEVNVNYHKRFFRKLDLSENDLLNTERMLAEDRVVDLLNIWMQKEGLGADFNHLIEVLLQLELKLSAENITARAVRSGNFRYQDE